MNKAISILSFGVLVFLQPTLAKTDVATLPSIKKVKTGEIKFTAVGKPGFLKIKGETKGQAPEGEVKIENGIANGEFSFELKHLTTGIDLRDEHMKEKYLEISKFPKARFILKEINISKDELNSDFEKSFSGSLNLHGETKKIDGKVSYNGKEKSLVATFTIKVSDFKIDIPSHMGITVSETVDVNVQLILD